MLATKPSIVLFLKLDGQYRILLSSIPGQFLCLVLYFPSTSFFLSTDPPIPIQYQKAIIYFEYFIIEKIHIIHLFDLCPGSNNVATPSKRQPGNDERRMREVRKKNRHQI